MDLSAPPITIQDLDNQLVILCQSLHDVEDHIENLVRIKHAPHLPNAKSATNPPARRQSMSDYNLDKFLARLEKRMNSLDAEILDVQQRRDTEYRNRKESARGYQAEYLNNASHFNDQLKFLLTTLNEVEARVESVLFAMTGATTHKST
ncbi:hypothetical protein BGW39_005463 [Mortierella sp. 14UC]|nr:hypothetical protein BGW39_005463 [Mortierella sp. 14UC]